MKANLGTANTSAPSARRWCGGLLCYVDDSVARLQLTGDNPV